jgi:hypothetical protein
MSYYGIWCNKHEVFIIGDDDRVIYYPLMEIAKIHADNLNYINNTDTYTSKEFKCINKTHPS